MSRKSQETIGPNVDIPATTEFRVFAIWCREVFRQGYGRRDAARRQQHRGWQELAMM